MPVKKWNGNGNWTGNPANWTTGSPPGVNGTAEIQTGTDHLTTTTTVKQIVIDSGAQLAADGGAALTTTSWVNNAGTFSTDSNSTVHISGVLTNSGTANIGNTGLTASTTVTAAGLVNSGSIALQGNASSGTTNQATLDVTGAAPTTATGSMRVSGDALLEYASGGITAIAVGAQIELDGAQARVAIGSGTTSTALTGLATNNGTLLLRGDTGLGAGGVSVTTTTNFANQGTLSVDIFGGDGGSGLAIGGSLTNNATITIGNTGLGASDSVTATSLNNTGSLTLQGNAASASTNQATLDLTGAAPATATGFMRVGGDALLEFASDGITAIAAGAQLELDGAQARIAIGSATTSTALTGLATNNGILLLRGDTGFGAGGASVTTTTNFANHGTLSVDIFNGDGGSGLAIGGRLTNNAAVTIGNTGLVASDSVTATSLAADGGTLTVQGNASSGTTNQATLNITGAAPSSVTSYVRVGGDALLEFASGAVKSISNGSTLELDGAQARVALAGNLGTSSALTKLATNYGTFLLRGDTGFGAGGASVTTTGNFTNQGTLSVDIFNGDGGSNLTIGGTLTNNATAVIGNTGLGASDTVTAAALADNAGITVQGNAGSGTTNQATVNIAGGARSNVTGNVRVGGDALLEFASGAVKSIGSGSTLELDGSQARVALAGNTATSSALTNLATNNGTFLLRGNTGFGAGGASVTTTTNFVNNGTFQVDVFNGDGGSSLTIGGRLTNNSSAVIGNTGLSASDTVTATHELAANAGSITVQGNASSGTTNQATLDIAGAAPLSVTGYFRIGGDALLEFGSGLVRSIASNSTLELDGSQARVALASDTSTSSALTNLATNNGTLLLRGGTGFGAGGASMTTVTNFTNQATLSVDIFNGDGGSSLTVDRTFSNAGTAVIGNTNLSAATTVTAAAFANSGTFTLLGSASHLMEVVSNGTASNTGSLTIGANTELDVTAGNSFVQTAGTTTVGGLLAASTVVANGGVIDFTSAITSGNGTGALRIGSAGTMEFDAAVDSSHTATFTASTGTLALTAPSSFAATIAGFSANDVIDLVGQQVTGLSYTGSSSSGVLTVSGSSGTIATLNFSGNYTTASFSTVSDGHGGTDILDPPTPSGPRANLALLAQYGASLGAGGHEQGALTVAEQTQPQLNLAAHS